MPVNTDRIKSDITALARITDTPGEGISRTTFSPAWRQARDYIATQAEAAGCKVRIDAAGNLHARPIAISWESPAWMSGSHIDSIPNGGNYDGTVGIIAALEALRAAREDVKVAVPLEIVAWAGNEPATFGLAMVGSRAFVGELGAEQIATLKGANGLDYLHAGAAHGVAAEKLPADKLKPFTVIGYIEIHSEEGPRLWTQGAPVACVTALAGRRQYHCEFYGAATHAGAVPMADRRDALAGAAETIYALENHAREIGSDTLLTVGRIECEPNIINVVPQHVTFTMDLRCPNMSLLANFDQSIRATVEQVADTRHLQWSLELTQSHTAIEFDRRIAEKMRRSAATRLLELPEEMSGGSLHDAAILAGHVPSSMLFIACRDGIGHSREEFCRSDDIAVATTILLETVRDRRLE